VIFREDFLDELRRKERALFSINVPYFKTEFWVGLFACRARGLLNADVAMGERSESVWAVGSPKLRG
jgi:hypothetical protein